MLRRQKWHRQSSMKHLESKKMESTASEMQTKRRIRLSLVSRSITWDRWAVGSLKMKPALLTYFKYLNLTTTCVCSRLWYRPIHPSSTSFQMKIKTWWKRSSQKILLASWNKKWRFLFKYKSLKWKRTNLSKKLTCQISLVILKLLVIK